MASETVPMPVTSPGSTGSADPTIPSWVFHFLPRSYNDYNTAHGGLVSALRTTGNNLQLWGDELVEVARDYAGTDADNAGTVGRAYN